MKLLRDVEKSVNSNQTALGHVGINTADIPGLEVLLCSTPDPFEKIDTAYGREKFYKNLTTW